jgi:glycerol-3-phosphate acyltransferase PlsX
MSIIAWPALKRLKIRMDPARYNGASLLGLNGIVVKSHGSAGELAFQHAIEEAMLEVKNNVVDLVRNQINEFINQGLLL